MARKPRIEFEDAFYHVITRGNQRQRIFKDNLDFIKYLDILGIYKQQYKYFLYSYVLMNNHVHLLIETREIPLSKILQGINQRYTMYFNKRYRTVGHLFQGRYKAILCDRDEYLLSLVKYIHLNPVRARVVKTLDEYQWSSHHGYAKKAKAEDIVDTDQVLRMFSEDKTIARRLYKSYIGDGSPVDKEDIYRTIDQRVLGDERFLDRVMEKTEMEVGKIRREREYTLPEIARGIAEAQGITLDQIREKSKDRHTLAGRKLFSLVSKEYGYKGKEIAEYIRKDPAVITRYLKEKGNYEGEVEKVIKTLREKKSISKSDPHH